MSQAAVTAGCHHCPNETHVNELGSWKRGVSGHHLLYDISFPNWYRLFDQSLLVTELFKMLIAHSGKQWLYCLLFSFPLWDSFFFYFFSSCGPHYSWTANDSQESHSPWILPLSVKTRLDLTCCEGITSSFFLAGNWQRSRFTYTHCHPSAGLCCSSVAALPRALPMAGAEHDFSDHLAICCAT